ncbi:hypothetical protein HMPREF9241_00200 [Schaalia turicensis ACS-279-V-Col4]|uniref:Tetrapyrrole biosynthesis uroporphyrinogen III synthase domain-containing protein n=1 Tax=Schaalia turicensis ACS-279-V-Col4 TaxID=883077 RepID=K0Z7W3_9ACTO|nr:uroporphyrinogen-III synthase [Schaalia turicensis]EJZ88339.1 hypothetical protein HMPREF9241_00200 [Schaalia turicensis ACS-279-V-Col4]
MSTDAHVFITRPHSKERPDPFGQAIEALSTPNVHVHAESLELTRTTVSDEECKRFADDLMTYASTGSCGWILFTSARTIRVCAHRIENFVDYMKCVHERGARIGVVGPATAKALKALGIDVDLQSEGSGEDLANAVVAFDRERSVQTREVLLPQSAIARVQLRQILSEASYPVRHYPVYTTVTIAPRYSLELARMCSSTYVTATVITAPSSARALKDVAPYLFPHIPVIVLGQASATTMAEIAPEAQVIVADHPTPDAVADCIKHILETHAGHSPQKGI